MSDIICEQTDGVLADLRQMGELAEKAVISAVDAFINSDAVLAQEVIDGDDNVDNLEISIEQQCSDFFDCHNILETDRRVIITILKVTIEFERIADHATDIAEIALRFAGSGKPVAGPTDHIVRLTTLTSVMLKDAMKAFFAGDVELAREVILADSAVDETYELMYADLITYIAQGHGVAKTEDAVDLLLISRYLERIADHATNVGEFCIFMTSGERVAHQKLAPYPPRIPLTDTPRQLGLLERLFGRRV